MNENLPAGAVPGKNRSTVVGAAILLCFFMFNILLMLYSIRGIDASYEEFTSLLEGSVRAILRGGQSAERLMELRAAVFDFIDRLARIKAKVDIGGERAELAARWMDRPLPMPLNPVDRDRLVEAIELLKARIVDQRRSQRGSIDALFAAISLALVASLLWSAALWHKSRLKGIEALWTKKNMRQVLDAEEETRKRIARDLHDDAIQDIAAARMLCDRAIAAKDEGAAKKLSSEAAGILAEAGRKLRGLAHDIRPPDLDRSDLVTALESLCARNGARYGKEIRFVAAELLPRLPDEAALHTYRIVQEAVTNSMKHGGENLIALSVESAYRERRQGILIRVEERPAGEDRACRGGDAVQTPPSEWGGLGMAIMRERASYIGGHIDLERCGRGLAIRVFVPARQDEGGTDA